VELRAVLANDDVAGPHALAAVHLDAQPLAGRIAAVADRPLTFLMRHDFASLAFSNEATRREPSPSGSRLDFDCTYFMARLPRWPEAAASGFFSSFLSPLTAPFSSSFPKGSGSCCVA